jgi:beta-galactosidase/beta-glucuronidase
MSDDVLHPNPQFARPQWTDLCGSWDFAYDDADIGCAAHWEARADVFDRSIIVPFPPESRASGLRETGYHPVVWYRRAIPAERPAGRDRLMLHFGAVDYAATVWVNGKMVGGHTGGHTPFVLDITDALDAGQREAVVVLRARDNPTDLAQPRGKQDWLPEPHAIWYHRTTGIWQPVWLEWVAGAHIKRLRWTPHIERAALALDVWLSHAPTRPLTLRVQLTLRGQPVADDTYQITEQKARREIALPLNDIAMNQRAWLWSPEHPNLIEAVITLLDGETILDQVYSYAGLRSTAIGGGRFLLNGRAYYLRTALEQGYWPDSHLAAPPEALRREVELAKELGFNGLRIHQKVEDPRFIYWCDRLGLILWGEMANAFYFSDESAERLTREWLEVLERDVSHPCIIAWVPINESWGVHNLEGDPRQRNFLRALYHLTKTFDPTRPVIDNDGWEHAVTDIVSIHDYARDGATLSARYGSDEGLARALRGEYTIMRPLLSDYTPTEGAPIMLTEFGGISYAPEAGTKWYGYGTVKTGEEYLAKLRELVGAVVACPNVAGFCYTQLTDTEQETNGLLLEDRTPKFDLAGLREIIQTPRR